MITRAKAYKLRALMEQAAESLSDNDALDGQELYPFWTEGVSYAIGDRVRYNSRLYKVVQAHTSQSGWEPPTVQALFTEVAPSGTIHVWVQPTGAQDAYMSGDKVHYPAQSDPVYVSTMDYNVYAPGVYGWELDE